MPLLIKFENVSHNKLDELVNLESSLLSLLSFEGQSGQCSGKIRAEMNPESNATGHGANSFAELARGNRKFLEHSDGFEFRNVTDISLVSLPNN